MAAKKAASTGNPNKRYTNMVNRLEDLCVNIFAHVENEWEITLAGNGTNASEATNVAYAVLDILHGDGRQWRQKNEKRIQKRVAELKKEMGIEEE